MTRIYITTLLATAAAASGATPATVQADPQPTGRIYASQSGVGPKYSVSAAPPIRIRCGGPQFVDSNGNTWQSDNALQYSVTGSTIMGTSTPALYQMETWSIAPITYTISIPNGTYSVVLKFAEFYFTKAGGRVFTININGSTVASNFDIVANAGPKIAWDITTPVTVNDGAITIQLVPIKGAAKIDAIEITSVDAPAPVSAPTITTFLATPSVIAAGQSSTLSWVVSGAAALTIDSAVGSVNGLGSVAVTPATTTTYHLTATNTAGSATRSTTVTVNATAPQVSTGLGFFSIPPCRVVDTRESQGKSGPFGPPSLGAYVSRDFPIAGVCGIPLTAEAFAANITAVPPGPLGFLSAWPSGQTYPGVSTLNSPDGSTIANAAVLSAGKNGSIAVEAGEPTDLVIDINGYFAPPNGAELAFYPITPCRMADTRAAQGKAGAFGPPSLAGYRSRNFPVLSSACKVPSNAKAYSMNLTAVPQGPLSFLSIWPSDQPYPGVSCLNANDGSVIANASLVAAAANGDVQVVTGNPTDLVIDINGYFAPPGAEGALHFYPLKPCRVLDTRAAQGKSGLFGPPGLSAYLGRDIPVLSSSCGIPSTAQAYSLNFTVVPPDRLDFLSVWPAGQPYPNVSTLNSPKGATIANAAIVPAGANGAITVISGNPTDLIMDINGYFAP